MTVDDSAADAGADDGPGRAPRRGGRLDFGTKRPKQRRVAPPLLRCRELAKDYGSARALGPIDLVVEAGESVALVGHNGSGKSTLLSLVAGYLEPSAGTVEVSGVAAGDTAARAVVSHIPDTPVLYDDLSLTEHLEYLSRLHGTTPQDQQTDALLDAFGLQHRVGDLPADFSRGLRQKAAITIAVCRPYQLLLVDEPFSGLDRRGKDGLLHLLARVVDEGGSVVVATHDDEVVRDFDRVVTLAEGEVVGDSAAD